jgi:hypothetical protein
MKNSTRNFIIAVVRPLNVVVGFLFRLVTAVLFGWLAILLQRRADSSLLYEVRTELYFLFPAGSVVKERWYRVLPFDYASVGINYHNVCFWITRGRGELNVSIAIRDVPRPTYEIGLVVAALDSTVATEQKPIRYLLQVADLLRPRIEAINDAFSESKYPEFKEKLSDQNKALRVLTKQVQWELDSRLRH